MINKSAGWIGQVGKQFTDDLNRTHCRQEFECRSKPSDDTRLWSNCLARQGALLSKRYAGFRQILDSLIVAAVIVFLGLHSANSQALSNVSKLSTGWGHTCSVGATGGVLCWGSNSHGQLGDNSVNNQLIPVPVMDLGSGVVAVAAGGYHTCALTTAGGVMCWGRNDAGQLGDNSITNRLMPVNVTGLASGVIAIAAGGLHTCALTSEGGVKCWGENGNGRLGDNSDIGRMTPVDVMGLTSGVVAIAAGGEHTCALNTAGGVRCWGENSDGQLGDNSTTNQLAPVTVFQLASGSVAITAGGYHTCALTTGGGVKCWGFNSRGQLGDGSVTGHETPVDVSGLASGVDAVTAGRNHTCALTTSGGVKCWGWNGNGKLGDNSTTDRATPVDVTGLASRMAGISAGADHNCIITTDHDAKCWGDNGFGQIGDNSTFNRSTPVAVRASLTNTLASQTIRDIRHASSTIVNEVTIPVGHTSIWSANGGASGNPVVFSSLTPTICAVSGATTVTALNVGTCTIALDQAGNANFASASRVTINRYVDPASQSIGAITFSPSNISVLGPVTASATGGSSGNPVTFSSMTPTVCVVHDTNMVTALQAGSTCTIAANQAGSSNYYSATEITQNLEIPPAAPAPFLAISPATARLDVAQDFTVTGSSLTSGMGFAIEDCEPESGPGAISELGTGTSTRRVFRCVPRLPGPKQLTLKDAPGGTVLFTTTVSVDHPARLGNAASRGIPAVNGVSLWNGNVHLEATDLAVPGKGVSFALTRSYNSYSWDYEAGHGGVSNAAPWRFNWDLKLGYVAGTANKQIWVQREDGSGENFFKDTDNAWYPMDQGNFNTIQGDTPVSGQTTLLTREGLQYIFQNPDLGGRLIKILDHDGNGLTVSRDGSNRVATVTDASNRLYTFTYDVGGNLSRVSDFTGRYVEYTWETGVSSVRLKTVRDVRDRVTTYNYALHSSNPAGNPPPAQFLLTSIVDPRGNAARTFTYTDTVYGNWGANSVKDALNTTWSFIYCAKQSNGSCSTVPTGAVSFQTTTTPPQGAVTITRFDSSGRLVEQVDANAKTSRTTPMSLDGLASKHYNLAALPTKKQSALGVSGNYSTEYAYTGDKAGNLFTQKDAENATTTRTWLTGTAQAAVLRGRNLHRVAKFASATGAEHNFTHTDTGNVLSYTPPALPAGGLAIALAYDAVGQVIGVTDSRGNGSTREYDAHGSLTKATEPGAPARFILNHYDNLGRVDTTTDKRGYVTTNTWDAAGNLLTVHDALNGTVSYDYDANGNRSKMTDARGNVTNYTYDANNRPKTVERINGAQTLITTTNYDTLGRIASVTNANGHYDSTAFDNEGNVLRRVNALGAMTQYQYDDDNRVTRTTDPENRVTDTTYDKVGRVKTVITAAGTTSYEYDADGRMTSSTDPRLKITQYAFDAAGRLITLTDANGVATHATYDANGNLLTVVDPNNHTTTYTYDSANRPLTRTDANGQQWVTTYDENGNVKTGTAPGNRTTTYTYDALNRVTQVVYPDASTVSYTYDANGNRLTMTDSTGTTSYTYDALDRLASKTDPLGKTVSYTYDGIGNVAMLGYPGGQSVSYSYDAAERLVSLTDWLGKTTTYTLNKTGQVTAALFSNGVRADMVFDMAGRMTSLINQKINGPVISSHVMTLDANGNITDSTTQLPLQPSLPNVNRAFTYDAANRLATYNGDAVTHDARGRITGLSGATYSYNDRDQITTVTGALSASHAYNGEGHRVMRNIGGQVTRFVIDSNRSLPEVLAETDSGGTVLRNYVYGYGLVKQIDSAGVAKYYHYDPTGSTLALTNAAGVVSDSYAYTPYGETTVSGSTVNPFRYVGKLGVMDDGNGMLYMRARFYRPEVARFMSLDQLAGSADKPQSLNRYAYVLGNPVMGVDPSGLEASTGDYAYETGGMVIGAITGTVSGWWNGVSDIGETLGGVVNREIDHPGQFAGDVIQTGADAWNGATIAAPYLLSGTKKVANIIVAGVTSGELGDQIIHDFKSAPQDLTRNLSNNAGVISKGYQLTVESGMGYEVGNVAGQLAGKKVAKTLAAPFNTAATVSKVVHMDNVIHNNLPKLQQKRHNPNAGRQHYIEGRDYTVNKNSKKNRKRNVIFHL